MGLSAYLQDTYSLLQDYGGLFTPQAQLTRWINEARRQIAYRTGCVRVLVSGQSPFGAMAQAGSMIAGGAIAGTVPDAAPTAANNLPATYTSNSFNVIPGVEKYPFDFANPYIRAQYAGVGNMFDIIDLSVSWGAERPTLCWKPWDEIQAYGRSYNVGVFSYPFWWSVFNDGVFGQVWLFPVPSTLSPGEMEWDVLCEPLDLNSDSDFDVIPPGWRNAVKFGAAALAFMGSLRYLNAAVLKNEFQDRLLTARAAAEGGRVSDYYWTAP